MQLLMDPTTVLFGAISTKGYCSALYLKSRLMGMGTPI